MSQGVECYSCLPKTAWPPTSSIQPCPIGLGNLVNAHRARDRLLQFSILNEEFLVNASHQLALITSLPFVKSDRSHVVL